MISTSSLAVTKQTQECTGSFNLPTSQHINIDQAETVDAREESRGRTLESRLWLLIFSTMSEAASVLAAFAQFPASSHAYKGNVKPGHVTQLVSCVTRYVQIKGTLMRSGICVAIE